MTEKDGENPICKGKILVVDDDPRFTKLMQEILTMVGYDVVTTNSGIEALKQIEAEHPDLILLDYMMPGVDGLEVCARLKRNRRTQNIPIIIVTGFMKGLGVALKLGINDCIFKPVALDELLASVKRLLHSKHLLSRSEFDVETALPGRQELEERLTELLFDEGWTVLLVELRNQEHIKQTAHILAREAQARFVGRWNEREFVLILDSEQTKHGYAWLKYTGLPLSLGMVSGETMGSFADAEDIVATARQNLVQFGPGEGT